MRIERYVPPAGHPLHAHVLNLWSLTLDARESPAQLVLPRRVSDLIFMLDGPPHLTSRPGEAPLPLPRVALQGLHTTTLRVDLLPGSTAFGVSLHVEQCGDLLTLPLHEITDAWVEGEPLLPGAERLRDRLGEAASFAERCRLLLAWLQARLRPQAGPDPVSRACRTLATAGSDGSVRALARSLHVSERHLRRLFLQRVGVGPRHYHRLSRFCRALELMEGERSLTAVAYQAGYSDQPHLCHDFQAIAGMTPSEYRRRGGRLTGLVFFEQDRSVQSSSGRR